MPSIRTRLLPICSACTSRLTDSVLTTSTQWSTSAPATLTFGVLQTRGATKKRKSGRGPETIAVRLLKDTPSFGKRGALVPVSAGQMRNLWFPQRQAAYVLRDEMKTLKAQGVPIVRDFEFGVSEARLRSKKQNSVEEESKPAVKTIDPDRALQILADRLPPRIDFYRKVNDTVSDTETSESTPEPYRAAVSRATSAGAADLVAARQAAKMEADERARRASRPIFGSVNESDLVTAIRSYLVDDAEAAMIVITEDDVRFVNVEDPSGHHLAGESLTRLKNLGSFEAEIRVKGTATETKLVRTVRVLPLTE